MTPRHIKAAEVRHHKRVKERERERERGIFSMTGFDSASSSFLALLVIKSYKKKLKSAKFERKISRFQRGKNVQTCLFLEFCNVTHLQDIKRFIGQ